MTHSNKDIPVRARRAAWRGATVATSPSQEVFASPSLKVGTFRAPASHPCWQQENRISGGPVVVFPRVPVGIATPGADAVVADADAGRIMFYNEGQCYRRELLDNRGDACEWFSPSQDDLRDILRDAGADPEASTSGHARFPFSCGPSAAPLYLAQRRLFNAAADAESTDPLEVELAGLKLVRHAVALAVQAWPNADRRHGRRRVDPRTRRIHAAAAEAARAVVARRFREKLLIGEIAREVHLSGFHLGRIFRQHTGCTLHRYVTMLRLAAALERLEDPRQPIIALALELGFANHAHFTSAFTRTFGDTPSAVRSGRGTRRVRASMSTISKA